MSATQAATAEFQNGGKPVAQPVYLVDTSGNPVSASNGLPISGSSSITAALITEDQIRAWIANGQGYAATTGKQTSASAVLTGLSIFNPSNSGKTIIVYSAKTGTAANAFYQLNAGITSDPALGTTATIVNLKGGGPNSIASATYANVAVTPAGSQVEAIQMVANNLVEFLTNGAVLVLPAGYGTEILANTSTNNWFAGAKWVEV